MDELRRALTNASDGSKTSASEEPYARLLSDLDALISELEKPHHRGLVRFAVSWFEFERQFRALKKAIDERVKEKQPDPLGELLEQLTAKG